MKSKAECHRPEGLRNATTNPGDGHKSITERKRIMAIATKEEERKALAKIKKIVEGLGEDSYVGTAFEGCFEIAEQNIDWDGGMSMKQKYETQKHIAENSINAMMSKDKEIESLKKDLQMAREAANFLQTELNNTIAKNSDEICGLLKERGDLKFKIDQYEALIEEYEEDREIAGESNLALQKEREYWKDAYLAQKAEVIRLKVKLFDMMDKEGEEA